MTGGIGANQTIKALKEGQWGKKSSGNMSRIHMLPQSNDGCNRPATQDARNHTRGTSGN